MSLLKSSATVSGLTLVSRVTGVIRDMLIARYFGASAETDAFYAAFRLPNMLRRLFAEGAFQHYPYWGPFSISPTAGPAAIPLSALSPLSTSLSGNI